MDIKKIKYKGVLIPILVSVSGPIPASCTCTYKNASILQTDAAFMLGDIISSS